MSVFEFTRTLKLSLLGDTIKEMMVSPSKSFSAEYFYKLDITEKKPL
jgi:hypothetical protein